MTTVLRAVAAAILASLVLAGVALAADPSPTIQPTVGGTLSAEGKTITVLSNGNVPAHVTMTAESVTLSETEFDIQPGTTHTLTFEGKAVGSVTALYTTAALTDKGDRGSAQLTLRLVPGKVPPPPFTLGDFGPGGRGVPLWIALVIAALALLAYRLKVWRWRLVTKPAA